MIGQGEEGEERKQEKRQRRKARLCPTDAVEGRQEQDRNGAQLDRHEYLHGEGMLAMSEMEGRSGR